MSKLQRTLLATTIFTLLGILLTATLFSVCLTFLMYRGSFIEELFNFIVKRLLDDSGLLFVISLIGGVPAFIIGLFLTLKYQPLHFILFFLTTCFLGTAISIVSSVAFVVAVTGGYHLNGNSIALQFTTTVGIIGFLCSFFISLRGCPR